MGIDGELGVSNVGGLVHYNQLPVELSEASDACPNMLAYTNTPLFSPKAYYMEKLRIELRKVQFSNTLCVFGQEPLNDLERK